jgi:hypothetical protein
MEQQEVQALANIIECKASNFPFIYLGMSLSDKKN